MELPLSGSLQESLHCLVAVLALNPLVLQAIKIESSFQSFCHMFRLKSAFREKEKWTHPMPFSSSKSQSKICPQNLSFQCLQGVVLTWSIVYGWSGRGLIVHTVSRTSLYVYFRFSALLPLGTCLVINFIGISIMFPFSLLTFLLSLFTLIRLASFFFSFFYSVNIFKELIWKLIYHLF